MDSLRRMAVQRLLDSELSMAFDGIYGTSNVEAILRSSWNAPSCFVFRTDVLPQGNIPRSIYLGSVKQAVRTQFAVLAFYDTDSDDTGSVDDIAEINHVKIVELLQGWRPVGYPKYVAMYAGGEGMTILVRNLYGWMDMFSLEHEFGAVV